MQRRSGLEDDVPCSLAVRPIGLLQELLISPGDVLGMECSVFSLQRLETPYEAFIPACLCSEASPLGDYLCFEGPHAITALKVFLSFES